jgi:hypothetical protein
MSTPKPGNSVRSQQKSISERITGLEQNFTRFLIGINQRIGNHEQRLSALEEQLHAVIELNGVVEVEQAINRTRVEQARANAAIEKARLDEGISDGYVTLIEKIEERSLAVGRLIDKDGQVIEPGRFQVAVPTIKPEFKTQLIDKGAGTVVDLTDGTKFEVLEVYNVDEEKAKSVAEAKQKAAQDAVEALNKAEDDGAAAAEAPAQEAASEDSSPVQE